METGDQILSNDLRGVVIGANPPWGQACIDNLLTTLMSHQETFPCTFAIAAAKKNALRFAFVESLSDQATWAPLTNILAEYLPLSFSLGRETSLVVFFGTDGANLNLSQYNEYFWAVLQYLHNNDESSWPDGIPADPEDPCWEFGFAGYPIFVVCNTPAHSKRRSRKADGFTMTFQPRWALEGLSAHTPRGAAARKTIRQRIRVFDGMEPYEYLGSYGDEGNREWRQYFLPDSNAAALKECPFKVTPNGPSGE